MPPQHVPKGQRWQGSRRTRDVLCSNFATFRFAGERLEVRLLLKELTGCTVRLQAMAESMGAGGITVASSSDARVISKLPTVALKRRDTVAAGAAPAAPEPQVLKNKRRALINKGPKAFKKADAPASFKKLAAAAAALTKGAVLADTMVPRPAPLPVAPPSGWQVPIMPTAADAFALDALEEPSDSADACSTFSQTTPSGKPLPLPSGSSSEWPEDAGSEHARTTASFTSLPDNTGLFLLPPPADEFSHLHVRSPSVMATSVDFDPAAPDAELPPLHRSVASPRADAAHLHESHYSLINSAPSFLPLPM